jgi:glycosyltransferase involved in cell wall biosynthesis
VQVEQWQPDAILVYGWSFNGHLKAIRHFKKSLPVLFRGDSTLLDEKKGPRAILRSLVLRQVYQNVAHAFYAGSNNKAYFLKYGLTEKQLSFAPHAVDNERFAIERADEVCRLRKKLGINNCDIIVLFAGKLEKKKAPAELLDAFSKLNTSDIHLLFAGNGPLENELQQSASAYKNIHFIGFQNQSQMPGIYQACDLFCLPSVGPGETWGLAVNEAMACKKAILVSDKVGCAADLVINEKNGIIFQAGNQASLTECLRQLTKSKALLTSLGEQSGAIIKDWDFAHIAAAIENKLTDKVNEPRGRK